MSTAFSHKIYGLVRTSVCAAFEAQIVKLLGLGHVGSFDPKSTDEWQLFCPQLTAEDFATVIALHNPEAGTVLERMCALATGDDAKVEVIVTKATELPPGKPAADLLWTPEAVRQKHAIVLPEKEQPRAEDAKAAKEAEASRNKI